MAVSKDDPSPQEPGSDIKQGYSKLGVLRREVAQASKSNAAQSIVPAVWAGVSKENSSSMSHYTPDPPSC